MIRIMLIEDHNIVRNGIKNLLSGEPDLSIVAEVSSGVSALERLEHGELPDVILSDINMPEMDGLTLCKEIVDSYPAIKFIFLSMYDQPEYIHQAFRNGARGYILKNISTDELIFAIKHIMLRDERYICSELAMRMLDRQLNMHDVSRSTHYDVDFSPKEIEILMLVAEGYTNQEIADQLLTSKRTVEGHRQSMIDKAGVRNSSALIKYAVTKGLIS